MGLSSGLFSATATRYIEETLTTRLYDSLGPLFNFSWALGTLFAYCIAEILPSDKDFEGLKNTELWRVIYCYFPASFFLLLFILLLFFVKYDSPKYLIDNDRIDEAKVVLKLIYKDCKDSNVDGYIEFIRS